MKISYLTGSKLLIAAGVCAGMLAASASASADTFSATYFQVTTSTATTGNDFHTGNVPTGTTSNNYVMSGLTGGMPVYNSGETGAAGASDVNSSTHVLEWWTPGTYGPNTVTQTGSGMSLVLTSSPTNMFPPNSTGSTNQDGFEETAILSGLFDVTTPGTVNFSVSADDDAFVYIDGVLAEDLGGIHGTESATFTSPLLADGWHEIQIFYADQDEVAANLAFTDGGTPVSATPEPGSLALLGTGVLGLAGTIRRRMKR